MELASLISNLKQGIKIIILTVFDDDEKYSMRLRFEKWLFIKDES
jgi:hypothetical protein